MHNAFQEKLEMCLANSGEAFTPFMRMIVEMFPDSSKKGSRQQGGNKLPNPSRPEHSCSCSRFTHSTCPLFLLLSVLPQGENLQCHAMSGF